MNSRLLNKFQSGYFISFALCMACGLIIFMPFAIVDGGLFHYAGDFNSQQISFYQYVNNFVKTSAGQYSWETDLGGSIINSYSFYLIGSPFFWLSTLFPARWMPFLMAPFLALKFGVAGFAAYGWLRRYAKNRNWAILGACLYSLSGFTVYNTFFNHFLDCIALFPFMLWALDEYMYNKRRALFALTVAVNAVNNYFFFAGQVVFLLIYFFVKLASKEYRTTVKKFLWLLFEAILGCAMGSILLYPAFISLMDNPRTIDLSSGFGFLMYYKVQQYFAIFTSLFLPPDPTYLPSIYTEGTINHTSLTAWLPVVSCAAALAFMRAKPKSAHTRIMKICFFMAFVPILNSAFYMLNSSYYARWFYMPILIMCCASMQALQSQNIDVFPSIKTVAWITAAFAVFGLVPAKVDGEWTIGVAKSPAQFWVMLGIALAGLLLFVIVLMGSRTREKLATSLLAAVLAFSVFYSLVHVGIGKFGQWNTDKNYTQQCYTATENIAWPDGFYRTDSYKSFDNLSMWDGKSVLQYFNSTVTPSIMEFYPSLGVKRDVSSKPEINKYALRGLLSVKYTMTPNENAADFETEFSSIGWSLAWSDDTYSYFENENFIPMGFAYDNYISLDALSSAAEDNRADILVRAIGLSTEQIAKYGEYLTPLDPADTSADYTRYTLDAAERRAMSAITFDADGAGFTSKITLDAPNLVFFSVPYDAGFTATVNGKEVEVEKVSNGMMAVLADAGENTIIFKYKTPGFALSTAISLSACAVWIIYAGVFYVRRKKIVK